MEFGIANKNSSIVILILGAMVTIFMVLGLLLEMFVLMYSLVMIVPVLIFVLAILNAVDKKMELMSVIALAASAFAAFTDVALIVIMS